LVISAVVIARSNGCRPTREEDISRDANSAMPTTIPFTFGKINTKASEKRKVWRIVGSPISAIFAKPANEENVTMAFDLSSI